MDIKIKEYKGVEIVHLDNVFNTEEMNEFWSLFDLAKLYRRVDSRTATNADGSLKRKGSGLFLEELRVMGNNPYFVDDILRNKYLQIASAIHKQITPLSFLNSMFRTHSEPTNTLLQFYEEDNDAYDEHDDESLYSICLFIHKEPKNFTGGQFYIKDLDVSVEKLNNTGILFPSYLIHNVKPIKIIDKNVKNCGRYSLSSFISEHEHWKQIYDKT